MAKYSWIAIGVIAFAINHIFLEKEDQDERYIKAFNKKKGWWRIKWAIITALMPFVSITFAIVTA